MATQDISRGSRAIVIAGTHSGVGKTTVSTALMAAYRRRGLSVQGFKIGPDFIDPGYHQAAAGRPSRNLDGWMLNRDTSRRIFRRAAAAADISIVEGVMGLFDGAAGCDESGSTAEMAKWLGLPVILVLDAEALARSAAAMVLGFEAFDPNIRLAGVIANKVAGPGHYRYLEQAIQASCRATLLGWLPKDPSIELPSRHLGLVMSYEAVDNRTMGLLADWVEQGLDLDRLAEVSAAVVDGQPESAAPQSEPPTGSSLVRIGIARDRAFCFYYQDNLETLEQYGAELVPWSPIAGAPPRGLQGLYFGGGYPELFASKLAANSLAIEAVRRFIIEGGPVYAECGGLMYLTEAIVDEQGSEFPMVGIFPAKTTMQGRLAALGYFSVQGAGSNELLPPGESIRGHQFRYSDVSPVPATVKRQYQVSGIDKGAFMEGYRVGNCLASYIHLHFLSNSGFAARWLDQCRRSRVIS
jgi:cobyrinic acid a,c-diamide synthase